MGVLVTADPRTRAYEAQIRSPAESPELKDKVDRAREVYGMGLLSGVALVASIDADPSRFRKARVRGDALRDDGCAGADPAACRTAAGPRSCGKAQMSRRG